jgi:hypothetical protein
MRLYRIKNAVRAIATEESGSRLTELPAGAVFKITNVAPDSNGMIEGKSGEHTVMLFLNDLEERAEPMNVRIPPATVRAVPEISQH